MRFAVAAVSLKKPHFFEFKGLLSACKRDFVLFDVAIFFCVAALFLGFSALLRFKANFLFSSFVSALYQLGGSAGIGAIMVGLIAFIAFELRANAHFGFVVR